MLRIVHPPPGGNGADPPARRGGRSPTFSLTADEARHLRASIKNTARAYGSTECLASVLGIPAKTLYQANRRRPSVALALAVARAAGMTLEAVISGALNEAGRCKACGARSGDGRALAAGAAS